MESNFTTFPSNSQSSTIDLAIRAPYERPTTAISPLKFTSAFRFSQAFVAYSLKSINQLEIDPLPISTHLA